MSGKRERNKQANRAAILAAARECFIEKAFDAITVRDLVRRTDLAAGTFYNYFPDKESVYRALLEERMQTFTDGLSRIRRSARNPREFIYGAYLTVFETVAEDPLFYQGILRNISVVRDVYEDSIMGLSIRALQDDIQLAIDRGVFPAVDVEYLAAAFYGVGFEMSRAMAGREHRDPAPAAELATNLFLSGIEGVHDDNRDAAA